jgi:hypothetical protein
MTFYSTYALILKRTEKFKTLTITWSKDDYPLCLFKHTGEFYIPDNAKSLCGLHWQAKVNPAVCSSAVIPGIVSEISLV